MSETYVLVTAARDEQEHIEKTIKSVIAQTTLPKKWVIVSDGSADRTDIIAKRYQANHDFIQFLRREPDGSRNFASQLYAFLAGVQLLHGIEYDFIGKLDADVSFEPDYYGRLLAKFREIPELGIAGGDIRELYGGVYKRRFGNAPGEVPGGIQLLRRQCYHDIGGYVPLQKGGHDTLAGLMARMKGWRVRSFPDIPVLHHRLSVTTGFQHGMIEYSFGYHPLFEMAKCISRIREKPYLIRSLSRLGGYCWSFLRREQRVLPTDAVNYLRAEQLTRLKTICKLKKPI